MRDDSFVVEAFSSFCCHVEKCWKKLRSKTINGLKKLHLSLLERKLRDNVGEGDSFF